MVASTENPVTPDRPAVLVTTWRRKGRVWGKWERDMIGTEAFYVAALQAADVNPLLVPISPAAAAPALVGLAQGLVVIGGEDLHPTVSGADPSTAGSGVMIERDQWELALLSAALDRGIPVIAICRGMQLLNALHGGTLRGEIAGTSPIHPVVPEQIDDALAYRHDVTLSPQSLLSKIYQTEERSVNSLHHQAIDVLGRGLTVVGTAPDGTIEAIESTTARWCAAMQWHPELLNDAAEKSLFSQFVEACSR